MTETTNLIKKKLPYVSDVGMETAINEIVKTLNSSKTAIQSTTKQNSNSFYVRFVDLTFSFPAGSSTITKQHNLSVTPTGWIIIDAVTSPTTTIIVPSRTNWNTTDISLYFTSGATTTTFKIRVFI